jgi:hypothetical protein
LAGMTVPAGATTMRKQPKKAIQQPSMEGVPTDPGYRRLTEDEIRTLQRHSQESLALKKAYTDELDEAEEKALRERKEREKQE